MKKTFYNFILIFFGAIIFMTIVIKNSYPAIYQYGINIGSPKTSMMYFGKGNYLYKLNAEGEQVPIVKFPQFYARFIGWNVMGGGEQGVSVSNESEMPDGIMVYWFSPFEDKLWRASANFDQGLLEKIKKHQFDSLLWNIKNSQIISNAHNFSFIVNYGPEGRAVVWISGGGESYILAKLQAKEVNMEENWDQYYIAGWEKSRQELIERRVSFLSEENQKLYHEGKLGRSAVYWDRQMREYDWDIIGNENFNIIKIFVGYSNGEQYHLSNKIPLKMTHSAPIDLNIHIENKENKQVEYLYIKLDEDELLNAFESISNSNNNEKIMLKLSPNKELTDMEIFVKAGKNIIEIKNYEAELRNIKKD